MPTIYSSVTIRGQVDREERDEFTRICYDRHCLSISSAIRTLVRAVIRGTVNLEDLMDKETKTDD